MEHFEPKPHSSESKSTPSKPERGLFEKWFKRVRRERDTQQEPTEEKPAKRQKAERPRDSEAAEKLAEPEKPQKQKLGERILQLLKIKKQHVAETVVRPNEVAEPVNPEVVPPSPELPLEKAKRVRRFARAVLRRVRGAAETEKSYAAEADGEKAKPLNVAPLREAAEDLRHAVDDLEEAIAHPAEQANIVADSKYAAAYESAPQHRETEPEPTIAADIEGAARPLYERAEPTQDVIAQVTERLQQRISRLEKRVEEEADRNKVVAAAAVAGLGVFAVAGVLLVGHQYLQHRKTKAELRAVNEQAKQQERAMQAQQQEFTQLKQQQLNTMPRTERREYYKKLSTLAHTQADITRETARDIRQAEAVRNVRAEQAPVSLGERSSPAQAMNESQYSNWRELPVAGERQAQHYERRRVQSAERKDMLEPLVRTESAERTERSVNDTPVSSVAKTDGALYVPTTQPEAKQGLKAKTLASIKNATLSQKQVSYASGTSPAAYAAYVALVLLGFLLVFLLIS